MVKPNYAFEKKRREQLKNQKKAEKSQGKLNQNAAPDATDPPVSPVPPKPTN